MQKCGNVISVAHTFEEAQKIAHKAIRGITLRLEPKNADTDAFLRGEAREDEEGFPPYAFPSLKDFKAKKAFIAENKSVMDYCPEELLSSKEEDWNHSSVKQTLERFDSLCPKHKELDAEKFFNALIRGGIQGCLYVADSANI